MLTSSRLQRPARLMSTVTALFSQAGRTTFMPVLAMVLGLALAGFGLFRATPRPLTKVPPGYVALVNQKGVLTSDWIAQVVSEEGVPFEQTTQEQRSRVLRSMIDEELLVQRALVLDFPETTVEVREVMATAVNNQIGAQVLARTPTDEELHAYYEAHLANYTEAGSMTLNDLVLRVGGYENADQSVEQAKADAAEAVYQLRSGAPLSYIKEHFGFSDSGPITGGEALDFSSKLRMGPTLYAAARALGNGEISDPIVDPDGVHVLVMERRELPQVTSFAAARARLYDDFRTEEVGRVTQANVRQLRSQAQILLAPGQKE